MPVFAGVAKCQQTENQTVRGVQDPVKDGACTSLMCGYRIQYTTKE